MRTIYKTCRQNKHGHIAIVAKLSLNNYFLLVMLLYYRVFRVLVVGAVCREGGFQLSIIIVGRVMH